MKEVTIYSTMTCPFCFKAKGLLNELNIPFNEISVDLKPKLREEMAAKAGRTSVPLPHARHRSRATTPLPARESECPELRDTPAPAAKSATLR